MSVDPAITLSLDATGHRCPLPVLMARKALAGLAAGQVLEVLADDPAAEEDFEAFSQATGHRLVRSQMVAGVSRFLIEKGSGI